LHPLVSARRRAPVLRAGSRSGTISACSAMRAWL
jgi:hypothetical protein